MIVTTKELFKAAYGKYALGAYNINNLEQAMGLFQGNLDSQAPFIIQISKGARAYTHKLMLEGLIRGQIRCSLTRYLRYILTTVTRKLAMIALKADSTVR